jgi:hypothetical protein
VPLATPRLERLERLVLPATRLRAVLLERLVLLATRP